MPFAFLTQVFGLYKNRQMKGSNLVVGLAFNELPGGSQDLPATVFRTLSYVFEIAKSGGSYCPVSREEVTSGLPHVDWCRPLWLGPLHNFRSGGAQSTRRRTGSVEDCYSSDGGGSDSSSTVDVLLAGGSSLLSASAVSSARTSSGQEAPPVTARAPEAEGSDQAGAKIVEQENPLLPPPGTDKLFTPEDIFATAPFWCYLYRYEHCGQNYKKPLSCFEFVCIYRFHCHTQSNQQPRGIQGQEDSAKDLGANDLHA